MDDEGKVVSWGRQLPSTDSDVKSDEKRESKRYSSFWLQGNEYRTADTVYLDAEEGPPYIALILSLIEYVKTKEKFMRVRWFLRPRELPEGLAEVDYHDDNKEIFLQWGSASNSRVDPASTIRKCKVVCTAQEQWNKALPTCQQIAAADQVFNRLFDTTTGKLQSLEVAIERFGAQYVVGIGRPSFAADKKLAEGGKHAPALSKKRVEGTSNLGSAHPRPGSSVEGRGEPPVVTCEEQPPKKFFNIRLPWQEILRRASEQSSALLLQNLDPWFSSFEVEAILKELLGVVCQARMLPPRNIFSYTAGEALVAFQSEGQAAKVLQTFKDNFVIFTDDTRPVVATLYNHVDHGASRLHGFFDANHFKVKTAKNFEQMGEIVISHCAQGNTIEYEMGLQWRVYQVRCITMWNITEQSYKNDISDVLVKGKSNATSLPQNSSFDRVHPLSQIPSTK